MVNSRLVEYHISSYIGAIISWKASSKLTFNSSMVFSNWRKRMYGVWKENLTESKAKLSSLE